jgi:hypothetical protein
MKNKSNALGIAKANHKKNGALLPERQRLALKLMKKFPKVTLGLK